jgi:hypothetical protein
MPSHHRHDDADSHSLARAAHDRLDRIEPKIDKLIVRMSLGMGGLAVIVFLSANGFLNLSKLSQTQAEAAQVQMK